jgi:hypothetical protein
VSKGTAAKVQTTYDDGLASPPLLVAFGEGLSNDEDRVADEGQGSGQRHPLEDALLRLGDMVVGRLLDKVAGGIGRGQELAARASGGGLSDISIRIRGDDAAGGEGGQEEDEQDERVGVLEDGDGARQALGKELRDSHGGGEERERRSETARETTTRGNGPWQMVLKSQGGESEDASCSCVLERLTS